MSQNYNYYVTIMELKLILILKLLQRMILMLVIHLMQLLSSVKTIAMLNKINKCLIWRILLNRVKLKLNNQRYFAYLHEE